MEKSIVEKMIEALDLAVWVGYTSNFNLNTEQNKFVWDLIDFGYEHEQDCIDGKCSLKKYIEFDLAGFEPKIDSDIVKLKTLIKSMS